MTQQMHQCCAHLFVKSNGTIVTIELDREDHSLRVTLTPPKPQTPSSLELPLPPLKTRDDAGDATYEFVTRAMGALGSHTTLDAIALPETLDEWGQIFGRASQRAFLRAVARVAKDAQVILITRNLLHKRQAVRQLRRRWRNGRRTVGGYGKLLRSCGLHLHCQYTVLPNAEAVRDIVSLNRPAARHYFDKMRQTEGGSWHSPAYWLRVILAPLAMQRLVQKSYLLIAHT